MEINENILKKYIRGEASSSERDYVLRWIGEGKENEAMFSSMKADWIFDNLPNEKAQDYVCKEVRGKIKPSRFSKDTLLRVAAVLLIPITIFTVIQYFSYNKELKDIRSATLSQIEIPKQNKTQLKYCVNPGVKGLVELPDGTTIWLNSNSQLKCPATFDSTFRMVELSGEGYFKVVSNHDWPMYVKTSKGITVRVTGTEFNLSSYDNDSELRFTLVSGKVTLIRESTKQEIAVNQLEEVIIPDDSKFMGKRGTADIRLNTSWKDGYLIFDNEPMDDVIKKMERWYGVNFIIKDSDLLKYNFTANFQSESITQVLELLKITSNIGYSIKEKNVTLFLK